MSGEERQALARSADTPRNAVSRMQLGKIGARSEAPVASARGAVRVRELACASSLLFLPVDQVPVILIRLGHRLLALASMIAGS